MNALWYRTWLQRLRPALLTCILLYAALLRLDALFDSYGPYAYPRWLATAEPVVERAAAVLVPHDWQWPHVADPYAGGDPINYLRFARGMRSFYQAHVREPMFLAATRFFLFLTGDADVGLSLTSITFSLLTVVATYAVGLELGSPAVGLAAAAAFGIDRDCVEWSIMGWRDETFTFFAVLSVWAWLRMARTKRGSILAGIVGGAACLTRITSLTLLAPAWLTLTIVRDSTLRRLRLKQVATAIAVTAALVAPYMINCAIQFGDPLFAINDHTRFYQGREGVADAPKTNAVRYTLEKFEAHPLRTIDTAVGGLFVYPFSIKWTGLDAWHPGLGGLLSWLAVGGLIGWLWQPSGRLLLLVLGGSLVPYMLTWVIPGGGEWRFTLHAYPFYLLAAFWMVALLVRTARAAVRDGAAASLTFLLRKESLWAALSLGGLTLVAISWAFALPYFVVRESLVDGESAGVVVSRRDRYLFPDGWSNLVVSGNVVTRFATQPSATIRIPLPESRRYRLVLRMDPLPYPKAPKQNVRVFLNGHAVAAFDLVWTPGHIGEYRVDLPVEATRVGVNELTLWSQEMASIGNAGAEFREVPRDQAVGLRLWYVQIVPDDQRTRAVS